jgi:hypothetical protein
VADGIQRDRWGRPYIYPPPARGKTHADVIKRYADRNKNPPTYRRVTKFIGQLEDTYQLEAWAQRTVAKGIAVRDDLRELAANTPPADKDTLDSVVAQAKRHQRDGLLRDLGSYLHHCTDLIDRDHTDLPSPSEYANARNSAAGETVVDICDDDMSAAERDADLDAYQAAKRRYGLRYSAIEQMRVYDPWEVAGTPDRIGTGTDPRFHSKHVVMDVKTGDIAWPNTQREFAMQFALYAHATPYDPETGRSTDIPMVDRNKAVIIHLPVGRARCELHFVDIQRGWTGCQYSRQVWEWRKETGLVTRLDEWQPQNHLEKLAFNPTTAESAMACPTLDELRNLWIRIAERPGGLSDEFRAAVDKRRAQIESGTP